MEQSTQSLFADARFVCVWRTAVSGTRVIMVDLAHTMPAPNNTTDANFLGGLRELIKHLKKVLEDGEAGRNSLNHAMDLSLKQTDSTS